MMHKLAEELKDHPGPRPETLSSTSIPGEGEEDSSSPQKPVVAAAIQEFSLFMGELLGAIKGAFYQTQEELAAASQHLVLGQHFEELFQGAPGGYLVKTPRRLFKRVTRPSPPCSTLRQISCRASG